MAKRVWDVLEDESQHKMLIVGIFTGVDRDAMLSSNDVEVIYSRFEQRLWSLSRRQAH